MGNHFHLVVETPKGNLVTGMKWFLGTHTARFNRGHKFFGYLFSGRSFRTGTKGAAGGRHVAGMLPQCGREFAVGQQERDEAATGVGRIAKGQVAPPNGAALRPPQSDPSAAGDRQSASVRDASSPRSMAR